jgi:hypothetical protein
MSSFVGRTHDRESDFSVDAGFFCCAEFSEHAIDVDQTSGPVLASDFGSTEVTR